MTLLSYPDVAARLGVSAALVRTMAAAADYAAERRLTDIPKRYHPYLDTGFPRPVRIGLRLRRIREADLQRWLEGQ